jgi:hypothetical protein
MVVQFKGTFVGKVDHKSTDKGACSECHDDRCDFLGQSGIEADGCTDKRRRCR